MKYYVWLDDKGVVIAKGESKIEQQNAIEVDQETFEQIEPDHYLYINDSFVKKDGYIWDEDKQEWTFDLDTYKTDVIQNLKLKAQQMISIAYPTRQKTSDLLEMFQLILNLKMLNNSLTIDTILDKVFSLLKQYGSVTDALNSLQCNDLELPIWSKLLKIVYKQSIIFDFQVYIETIVRKIESCQTKDCVDTILSNLKFPSLTMRDE